MYKLVVTKFEKNELYEAELKEMEHYINRPSIYHNIDKEAMQPRRELPCEMLAVMLTDEQWEAVQKAVLSTFK
jgi:hypothetical protein